MELIKNDNNRISGHGVGLHQNSAMSSSIEVASLLQDKGSRKLENDNSQVGIVDEAETSKFQKYFVQLENH